MREWLRGVLGRTKLDRIERLQHEQVAALAKVSHDVVDLMHKASAASAQRVTTIANEIVQLERSLLTTVQDHRQQMQTLATRLERIERSVEEQDRLRNRLEEEQARVRELADQTGHLLAELAVDRQALVEARERAAASAVASDEQAAAQLELAAARRERDALHANIERLEAAHTAIERARQAMRGELERVTKQRDALLQGDGAGAPS